MNNATDRLQQFPLLCKLWDKLWIGSPKHFKGLEEEGKTERHIEEQATGCKGKRMAKGECKIGKTALYLVGCFAIGRENGDDSLLWRWSRKCMEAPTQSTQR